MSSLGFCTASGTIIPSLYHGQMAAILHDRSGQVTMAGVLVSLLAIAVSGAAGASKEREITPEEKVQAGERNYSFARGLIIAIFAGIVSSFFAFGLDAGKPIGDMTKTRLLAAGRADLWQNLPVLIVVLWGGFLTNFVWSVVLIVRTTPQRSSPASLAATPWEPHAPQATRSLRLMRAV